MAWHYQSALKEGTRETELMNYLNPGSGEPCAGQINAIPLPSVLCMPENWTSVENLGLALPMGSTRIRSFRNVYLNPGIGDP